MRRNVLLPILLLILVLALLPNYPIGVDAALAKVGRTCSDMGVPNEPDSMSLFLSGGTVVYALEPADGSYKVALSHSSWAGPYELTPAGALLPSNGTYTFYAVAWGDTGGGGGSWGGGGGGGGSYDPQPAPPGGGGGSWGGGGGGGGYWGAGIRVCAPDGPTETPIPTRTPTRTPSPTPTREPVPSGCFLRDLPNGATTSFTFNTSAKIYSWGGTTEYWQQYGGYQDEWITLPQYGSATTVTIQPNRYETFRPASSTPGSNLLVCGAEGTPTPTPTPTQSGCVDINSTWSETWEVWIANIPNEYMDEPWDVTITGSRAYAWYAGFWFYPEDDALYPYETGDYFNANANWEGPNLPFTLRLCPVTPPTRATTCLAIQSEWDSIWHAWDAELPPNASGSVKVFGNAYANGWRNSSDGYLSVEDTGTYFNANWNFEGTNRPFTLDYCAATAIPTNVPTRTPPATWTIAPPVATRTATLSPTVTQTPLIVSSCVGTEHTIPRTPSSVSLTVRNGQRIYLADSGITVTSSTWTGELYPGEFVWGSETGSYEFSALTGPARMLLCEIEIEPTVTGTPLQTGTPTVGIFPTHSAECSQCVSVDPIDIPVANLGPLPDIAIAVPTLRPLPTITATVSISITAIIGGVQTIEAGMQTPAAAVATLSAGYTWESGDELGQQINTHLEPIFAWLTLMRWDHPAWHSNGGPLWAIWPVVWGLLPLFVIVTTIALIVLIILFINWLNALFDIIVKLIELIPGE